eukprot:2322645-Rhodomonas_salina.1
MGTEYGRTVTAHEEKAESACVVLEHWPTALFLAQDLRLTSGAAITDTDGENFLREASCLKTVRSTNVTTLVSFVIIRMFCCVMDLFTCEAAEQQQLKQQKRSSQSNVQVRCSLAISWRYRKASAWIAAVCFVAFLPLISSSIGSTLVYEADNGTYVCMQGYSGPKGGPECAPCGMGMYQDTMASEWCKECPSNTFAGTPGSVRCQECPAGSFAGRAASECTSCPYKPENAVFPVRNSCEWVCMSGFFLYEPDMVCHFCPEPFHAPMGSTSIANCTDAAMFMSVYDDWNIVIELAVDGATILLSPGIYTRACDLTLSRDLTLKSTDGSATTILDCRHASRHFHAIGATITIE